jgi:hypothetical protein
MRQSREPLVRPAGGMDVDTIILIAAHKPAPLPSDPVYLPVQVGSLSKPKLYPQSDDTGENISAKNPHYCELTALYWAWKNLNFSALGLTHYRRYFVKHRPFCTKMQRVLIKDDFTCLLSRADVLVPTPRHYFIETTWSQYAHAHHEQDLVKTREVLAVLYPAYLKAFDHVMKKRSGHRFNMFVMKREPLDAYCSWLFGVLFALEERLDITGYTQNDSRVFGFIAERLLDVWLETNQIHYLEVPVAFMEKQNWLRKGGAFILRKLRHGARRG